MKKAVIVIGLGNTLMSDEGIGIWVVRQLSGFAAEFPYVNFVDAGTGGMAILHLIRDKDKAIFIDCAKMGQQPGTIRKFTPQEIKNTKVLAHQSLHEADLIKIIDIAKQLGQCPADITIFGIEPQSVKLGLELSETLAGRLNEYVTMVRKELANTNPS
ncbi:MAG: hydrogenase maturation protease [Phycisphaerae bacterium]|nr:hydrogenase maturation protease [Phycisphaerae bacterium]